MSGDRTSGGMEYEEVVDEVPAVSPPRLPVPRSPLVAARSKGWVLLGGRGVALHLTTLQRSNAAVEASPERLLAENTRIQGARAGMCY